jgi:hypothetical protein
MLSPVKIFDGKGNLKEIVTKEMVEDKYWKGFKTNNHIFAVKGSTPDFNLLIKTITCGVCKNEFETTHAKTLYCGKKCAHKMVENKRKEKMKIKKEARENDKHNKP